MSGLPTDIVYLGDLAPTGPVKDADSTFWCDSSACSAGVDLKRVSAFEIANFALTKLTAAAPLSVVGQSLLFHYDTNTLAVRDGNLTVIGGGSGGGSGPGGSLGLTYGAYGALTPVDADSVPESELVVHDVARQDPSYAFALSRLDSGDFAHTPIGVFRSVPRPSYDTLMADQIDAARAGGEGDLATLLAGNDTWEVG